MGKQVKRREFLKTAIAVGCGGSLAIGGARRLWAAKKSRVVLIRRETLWGSDGKPDSKIVQEMIDEAVATLLGAKNPREAWKMLVKPEDVVGIKSNVWQSLPTPPEVEAAIRDRILEAGVPEAAISVRDRNPMVDPVFRKATALINTRPMRVHHWSGVGTCLKNYITFAARLPDYHPDSCADLGALWKLPAVAGKTRLNILVMFTPLFHSLSPRGIDPAFTWKYNGLIVGTDPVAVDATGLKIIEVKRKLHFGEDRPINPPPKHIQLADTRYGLGTADPEKIELIRSGDNKEILI